MEKIKQINLTIFEVIILLFISTIMKNDLTESILIILEFIVIRAIRDSMHYDNTYKCIVMSTLIMVSNFLVLMYGFDLAIISTFLSAIFLSKSNSGKRLKIGDIFAEGFMYKKSKYDKMIEFRSKHINEEKMQEFERRLNKHAPKAYMFYEMRIIKEMKYREIEKELECDNRKITDQLDIAFSIFRTYFDIED